VENSGGPAQRQGVNGASTGAALFTSWMVPGALVEGLVEVPLGAPQALVNP